MTAEAAAAPRRVAAWDFDGTITRNDTLLGFLTFVAGRRAVAGHAARHGGALARGTRHDAARDHAKERLVGAVLMGRSSEDLVEAGRRYSEGLPDRFRADSVNRMAWHRGEGHEQVIVSASLEYYLQPLSERLDVDEVIAVRMEFDDTGVCTGRFDRPNVRGAQKAVRLREWIAATGGGGVSAVEVELWAYGNSAGDRELLAMASHPTWIS